MTYYRFYDGKKEKIIDEKEKIKLIDNGFNESFFKSFEVNKISLILNLLSIKELWLNQQIYDRNEKKLKEKLLVLNAVVKIKEQLLLKKDIDLVLNSEERKFLPEITNELKNNGIILTHGLSEKDSWKRKLENDKKIRNDFGRCLNEN